MNSEKFEKAKSRLNELSYTQVQFNEFVDEDIDKEVAKEIKSFLDSKIIDVAKELVAAADEDKTEEALSWINGWYKGMAPISDLKAFEVSVPIPTFKEGNKND